MNGHDGRGIVPTGAERLNGGYHAQGNNVASVPNSNHLTIKIDSLSIKLGIVKEKGDAQKCKHFSIRGYVAGRRERGSNNLLPFTEELPPMDVPNFRYWLCQMCLQSSGTASTSHETPSLSSCNQCVLQPCARPDPPQDRMGVAVLPFGEGTSGLKRVDTRNDGERIIGASGADKNQSSQEIPANAAVSQELTKLCSINTNAAAPGKNESNALRLHEDQQQTSILKETIASPENHSIQQDQQNDYPNGHPKRKARKVRLLKELLCEQQKKENSTPILIPRACSTSSQPKRKMLHDQVQVQDQNYADVTTQGCGSKKAKVIKGNEITKSGVAEHSRDQETGVGGENTNKYQWNKIGTQRSAIHGKACNDPVTAWRSIFSDMGRADNNQVTAGNGGSRPALGISKGKGTEPYSNFMAPPKPDKKSNPSSKKIPNNPVKSKFFGEGSKRINVGGSRPKDRQSDTELGLGLSLSYDPQAHARSLPPLLNRASIQDHSRKDGFFFREPCIAHRIPSGLNSKEGSVHDVSNRYVPGTAFLQEQQPYTQLPYGSCAGNQKLDFSDLYQRNTGVRGYSDIPRPHNHQRQEKFSIGRSDEREVAELMAKNQYERSLCEAWSHFASNGNSSNGIPNTSGFHKVNMNEGISLSHHGYLTMTGPTSENTGPATMRNPATDFFHPERVSSFAMFDGLKQSQKRPHSDVWPSDSGPQRHHNSRYQHHSPINDNMMARTHIYPPTNMQALGSYNNYHTCTQQNGVFSNVPNSMTFGEPYTNYSDKDKGKNVMDLDLNLVAPTVVEERNNFESVDPYMNPKHMRSLDSSYSNEAIPAMQLLSLMDAGKPTHPLNTDVRKFSTKPHFPSYSHCSSTMTGKTNSTMNGKTNSIVNSHFPYSTLRPCVQQDPVEISRCFLSSPESSSSLAVGSSLHSVFRTDQNVKFPSGQKSRGMSLGSVSHVSRPDGSYVFPLPWHATEDQNKLATLEVNRSFGRRFDSPGTEVCSINRNPADFSTPGPENEYMVNPEDLLSKGKISYKGIPASVNVNELKRQKKVIKPTS